MSRDRSRARWNKQRTRSEAIGDLSQSQTSTIRNELLTRRSISALEEEKAIAKVMYLTIFYENDGTLHVIET